MSQTEKQAIRFGNFSPAISKVYLDVFALKHFGEKYEDDKIKKKVNKELREMMEGVHPHPRVIEEKIMLSVIPKTLANKLNKK